MAHWSDLNEHDRLARIERKAEDIRKLLFGAVILTKALWKEELSSGPEGIEIMEAMEAAEESFAVVPPADRESRLEQTIDIVSTRARSILDAMSYVSRRREHD